MSACRAFGHDAGRVNRKCVVCKAAYDSIRTSMNYWFRRVIEGRPSDASWLEDPRASRKQKRGCRERHDRREVQRWGGHTKFRFSAAWLRKEITRVTGDA